MAAEAKRGDALQFIFSFFLGLLLVVFVGVGVWTFYPQPDQHTSADQRQLDRLYRQLGSIEGKDGIQPQNEAEYERIQKQIDELNEKMQKKRDTWSVNTSVILLTFATLLMAISLFLPEHMKVFSNGVLLGGVFTVIYGTGWSFTGGDSRARFYVVLAALVLSIGIGYLRFIRERKGAAESALATAALAGTGQGVAPAIGDIDASAVAGLAARVSELERRAAAAAAALGASDDAGRGE